MEIVKIDNTEPPIPTEQSLYRIPWWMTLSKAALKSICTILASCPLSNGLCSMRHAQNCITGTQTFPIRKLGGWKHTTALHKSSKANQHKALKHHIIIIIIIIIIIKKDWQCKAGRGRLPPYQSEDPSPTLPTYRGKEEKGKIVEDKKVESN